MDNRKIKVGITHGDINGIGYEIILKTLEDPRIAEICTPIVYGSAKIASAYRKMMDLPEVKLTQIDSASLADGDNNYIINVVPESVMPEPGQCTPAAGQAAFAALDRAVSDLSEGLIDVLVTCPISKDAIHSDAFAFPGHTEFLQDRLAEDSDKAMMIMAGDGLRVALVTIHEALADVSGKVTREAVTDSIMRFNRSLINDFGIHSPRIAVLSLNPHAGDNGVIGTEDNEIVMPAIAEANKKKVFAFGPYPADGFFGSGAYKKFDGVLAMYHDQGLIPFKLLIAERGVNFTAGLRAVRTSPDHGTAFDIAGKDQADPQSLREAIYMALDIYRNRQREAAATANPLRKQNFDRGRDRD
ncbi:MAG: 4-hydroxythreonine-4-phosphate dehydrogenase PdxA [Duncaniella sp.]|nr:4-hydroxythreonine-4-phosphate dehydrogenase PdxA [Duncaniella sp.]